jgi:uncharacterized protein with NRDE domain
MTSDLRIGVMYVFPPPLSGSTLIESTNIRHPHKATTGDTPSRGKLLKEYLAPSPISSSRPRVEEYLRSHEEAADQYEGFNLLLLDLKDDTEVGYLTNRPQATYTDLSSSDTAPPTGTSASGLSNSPMDKPFEKVEKGKGKMIEQLNIWSQAKETEDDLIERLMDLLS